MPKILTQTQIDTFWRDGCVFPIRVMSAERASSVRARLEAWEAQDVYLFYLPTYSPHLNKIETLWRKINYEWLRPEAYADFKTLKTAVWHILDRVGQQYTIQFKT